MSEESSFHFPSLVNPLHDTFVQLREREMTSKPAALVLRWLGRIIVKLRGPPLSHLLGFFRSPKGRLEDKGGNLDLHLSVRMQPRA